MKSNTTGLKTVRFASNSANTFYDTVKKRVDNYFQENNISRYADWNMKIKTIFMILLYLIPYGLVLSGATSNAWVFFLLWLLMGSGMAGIGLAIMHDANHGSYSKKQRVNEWLGSLINLVGGNPTAWKIQHNVLHHTYTNVDGLDEDISPAVAMRFSPHKPWRPVHRFQFIYAWFFYGLMTIFWATAKEFLQVIRYNRMDLLRKAKTTLKKQLIILSVSKVIYFIFLLVLPLLFSGMHWALVVGSFLAMHFTAGLILAAIFQPAHVMEDSEYPLPLDETNMENTWAVHQLYNTTNFAPSSSIFSWFVGGLNFQIEHHLFPNICHIHYKNISVIVKEVAGEHGLPYYEQRTFGGALLYHTRMLRKLGRPDVVAVTKEAKVCGFSSQAMTA